MIILSPRVGVRRILGTFRAEIEGYDLRVVASERDVLLPRLYVPQLGCVVHSSCGKERGVWVEGKAYYFALVALESGQALTGL